MNFITLFLTFVSLAAAALNSTREYFIKTELKATLQYGKSKYDNLWLSSYHTGAGLSDVVFSTYHNASTDHMKGFLNGTNVTANGVQYANALFDFGNEFPWGLLMAEYTQFYTSWQPVRVNAGVGGSSPYVTGFFINETGLQWTSNTAAPGTISDAFGGWLVCDWWHGVPQLFFRIGYYNTPAPSSCADVYLKPVYI